MGFMYLVFTRMPGESYRRRLRPLLLYLCYVFPCGLIFVNLNKNTRSFMSDQNSL